MTNSDIARQNSNGSSNFGAGSPNRGAGSKDGGAGSGIRRVADEFNPCMLPLYVRSTPWAWIKEVRIFRCS